MRHATKSLEEMQEMIEAEEYGQNNEQKVEHHLYMLYIVLVLFSIVLTTLITMCVMIRKPSPVHARAMDFEFSPLPRGDWVLLTDSMVNSLEKYEPVRLVGQPIILPSRGKPYLYHSKHHEKVIGFTKHVFTVKRNKPELLTLIEIHLTDSQRFLEASGVPTLTTVHIEKYLNSNGQSPVVVLWNGITDKEMINRLTIQGVKKYLNIITKWDKHYYAYELILEDLSKNKNIIYNTLLPH